jgi:hypothetical protein
MIAHDVPDSADLRKQHHDAHIAHVTELQDAGRITMGGPLRTEEGDRSIGAIIIFEADSLASARATVDADPYVSQGVFADVVVSRFYQAIPSTE